jgi:putative protein kinase ArgK-like GTPase of G3E family
MDQDDMQYDFESAMQSKEARIEYAVWEMQTAINRLREEAGIKEAYAQVLEYINMLKANSSEYRKEGRDNNVPF